MPSALCAVRVSTGAPFSRRSTSASHCSRVAGGNSAASGNASGWSVMAAKCHDEAAGPIGATPLAVNPADLRALEGEIVHQASRIRDEADHRARDLVGIDRAAGAHDDHDNRAVYADPEP